MADRLERLARWCGLLWDDPYVVYRLCRYRRHLAAGARRAIEAAVRDVPPPDTVDYHASAEAWRARHKRTSFEAFSKVKELQQTYDHKTLSRLGFPPDEIENVQRLHQQWLEGKTHIPITKPKKETRES